MQYFSFEIKTRPYTSIGSFPKEKEIETLGRKIEALCEKQTEKLSGDIKDYCLFFCEKLILQQVDFREIHEDSQNPWSNRESDFSFRDSKHKNVRYGARKQGQMENSHKREKGKKRKETLIKEWNIRAKMKSITTRATNWLRKR